MTATFIAGASTVAAAAIALFFAQFWRDTRDRLFLLFAIAFAIFAVNRILLTVFEDDEETQTLLYLARAGVFVLIIAAIVDKNRSR